ncbi:MAG: hypothetical protein ACI867_001642, partial [Glaciecola sp.]
MADLEEMMLSSSRVYNTLFEQRILFL